MSETKIQAGQYQLVNVYLRNYLRTSNIEISNLIVGFTLNESMSSPFIYGKTTVFDGSDILSTLPVIGEEFIEFTYIDFFGQTRIDEFMVYSVSDIKYSQEANPTLIQYTLNFVSIPRILTDGYRIMRGFRDGKISDYVDTVFNDHYIEQTSNKNLKCKPKTIEFTDGVINLTVPNYNPTETLMFFARYAFNNESNTQTYRFFENRDRYFFATNEYVKKYYGNLNSDNTSQNWYNQSQGLTLPDAHVFNYNYLPDITPQSQNMQMFNILNIDFGEKVNSMNDIKYGAYMKRIGQIDLLNGTAQMLPTYSIQQDFTENNQKLAHTQPFIDALIPNKYVRFVIKDYAVGGEPTGSEIKYDMKYSDLYDRKSSYLYHYKQNSVDITIYGRNNIVAGSVINLQLPLRKIVSATTGTEIDVERSGYYLADTIQNIFVNKTYTQKITLSRYGIGTK